MAEADITAPPVLHLTREDSFMISWSEELAKLKNAHAKYEKSGMSPSAIRKRIGSSWVCFVCWMHGHFPGRDCPRVRELHQRGLIDPEAPLDKLFAGNAIFNDSDAKIDTLPANQLKKRRSETDKSADC